MNIAVFGWYGHENAGDERIKFCLKYFLMSLGGIERVDFFDLHEHATKGKTEQFNHYDLIIIGGGGLILSQYNYHDFILGLKTKILTAGISIETELKGNPKKFALALLEKSVSVLVRDAESENKLLLIDRWNKVKLSSDLTFLEPYETVSIKSDNLVGINLLPKPRYFKYSMLASPFVSFVLRQCARLGIESVLDVTDFRELISRVEDQFSLLPIPLYCAPQSTNIPIFQKNDVEFLKLYFSEVSSCFASELIDNCCVFLSMRLHGSIFALQKGIPVISLSYLPKNRNFMNRAGLDEFVFDTVEVTAVLNSIERILRQREEIREKMSLFKENTSMNVRKDIVEALNLIK